MIENATVMLAGSPCVTTFASCVTQFITTPTNIWFPLFTLAIGMVLAILVVIYALSPLLGRNDIKTWVRIKIYELLLTLVIALVF
ncbi:MAG: hypothetical protein KGH62_03495, partial [Candidatus Micrarchaeota archaeon]|nr:hypothetical protein [Candidatus Micrarchaeota archaeon]